MAAVWVIITIPSKEYEIHLKEKESNLEAVKRPKNGLTKNELHTINEANENLNNEYKNKIDNLKEPLFETTVEESLSFLGIEEAVWQKSKNGNYFGISFAVDLEDSDAVIQYFKNREIGSKLNSRIGIIPFSLYHFDEDIDPFDDIELEAENGDKEEMRKLSHFKALQNSFLKSVTARLTVAQVVDNVRSGASLTFDFVCYLIFASWIAAMGLLDNSVVSLVASMLVSPMMGPVMALTFGTIIKDSSLRWQGFRNLGVCFAITILFGYFFGVIALNFTDEWADQEWPTNMMRERGLPRVAWVGTLVAFPSGCAVAISLLSGNEASLVGVAISVSLLPPAVNAGLLWAFSTLKTIYSINEQPTDTYYSSINKTYSNLCPSLTPPENYKPFYDDNLAIETALLGCLSLVLSLVNITNIFFGALILLKIKEIAPLSSMSPNTRRFFKEDIKIVREYNAEHGSKNSNMGEAMLKEWADMNGIDANELMSNKPEARATQIQTLNDIIRDVEADDVYRSVTRTRMSTHNSDFIRRMSQSLFQPLVTNNAIPVNNEGRDGRRRSSQMSANIPHVRVSGVQNGAIAHRRNGRRGSRLSQITPTFITNDNDFDRFSMREPISNAQTPTIRMPLSAGPTQPTGGHVFTFGDNIPMNDMNRQTRQNQYRRNSQILLRQSLHNSEHSPYSLWPAARMSPASVPRFLVTPVNNDSEMITIDERN